MLERSFHEYIINSINYGKKIYNLTQEEVDKEIEALAADIGFRQNYEERQKLSEKLDND